MTGCERVSSERIKGCRLTASTKTEKAAQELRAYIRKRAGLAADWDRASEDMRNFYREIVRRINGDDA